MKSKYGVVFLVSLLFALSACEPIDDPDGADNDRDKFLGSWTCTESNRKDATYEVVINESASVSSEVSITNFGLLGDEASPLASVSSDNITVASQYCCSDTWHVEGDGLMTANDRIDWQYELNDGSTLYQISAVYDKN